MLPGEGEPRPGVEAGEAVGAAGAAVPVQAEVPRGDQERPGRVRRPPRAGHRDLGPLNCYCLHT